MAKGKRKFVEKIARIKELQKEAEKERRKAIIECAHQNEKGKLKIHPVNEKGDYECKYCEEQFNMNSISRSNIEDAIETMHNAIQQIRCFSDPEDDAKLVRLLGELDFNMQEVGELYERIVNLYGKNKKKNRGDKYKDHDSFGSYGASSLSFIGGGKKNK